MKYLIVWYRNRDHRPHYATTEYPHHTVMLILGMSGTLVNINKIGA